MDMHKALHPRDDVDRLYVARKEEEKGLTNIENSVDVSMIQRFEDYKERHRRKLISASRNNTDKSINRTETTKKQKWEERQLYGRFKQLTSDISYEKKWTWLRKGNIKRETESLLTL